MVIMLYALRKVRESNFASPFGRKSPLRHVVPPCHLSRSERLRIVCTVNIGSLRCVVQLFQSNAKGSPFGRAVE